MSQPSFPDNPQISRDDAVNQIISSIAMEELGLSHILNAEGEKLQYILGTLPGVTGPDATIQDVLNANSSIRSMLESASYNQLFLKSKLQQALTASEMQGPTGATGAAGPTGPSGGAAGPTGATEPVNKGKLQQTLCYATHGIPQENRNYQLKEKPPLDKHSALFTCGFRGQLGRIKPFSHSIKQQNDAVARPFKIVTLSE